MNYYVEKKQEFEAAAVRALKKQDYQDAYFQIAKAAECGFSLAEIVDGELAKAYLQDAQELLELAREACEKSGKLPVNTSGEVESSSHNGSQWIVTEKPSTRLDDVIGLAEVKRAIRDDIINVFKYPEAYKTCNIPPGGGVLMVGPPGNGKTHIAKAIAGELDATFFSVSASQIKDKYVGESEKNMRSLFEAASQPERAIIFIDEIHSLLGQREDQKTAIIDEFLILSDGLIEKKNHLLILGATNYPWLLDDAVIRRLGKQIYVGMPDSEARKKLFEIQFSGGVPCEISFPFDDFAAKSEGFSGADIKQICTTAKKQAIARMAETNGQTPTVGAKDVYDAITNTIPTVSNDLLERYRQWQNNLRIIRDQDGKTI